MSHSTLPPAGHGAGVPASATTMAPPPWTAAPPPSGTCRPRAGRCPACRVRQRAALDLARVRGTGSAMTTSPWAASRSPRSPTASAPPPTSWTRTKCATAAAPTYGPSPTPTSSTRPRRSCAGPWCTGCRRRASAWTSAPPASWNSPSPPASRPSGSCCTATPRAPPTCGPPCGSASAGSSSTAPRRSPGWPPRYPAGSRQQVMVRVVPGHRRRRPRQDPHRHRRPEVRPVDRRRLRTARHRPDTQPAAPRTGRPALPLGLADHHRQALSVGRTPADRPAGPASASSTASPCPNWTSAAATASPTAPASPRSTSGALGTKIRAELAGGCAAAGLPVPRLAVEPGRAIAGPAGVVLYRVLAVKRTGAHTFVAVDGGMSDNPRPALYGVRYAPRLIGRRLGRRAGTRHRRRAALRGRRCPRRRCPAPRRHPPRRPAGRPRRRRVPPLHGLRLQPRRPPTGHRRHRRACPPPRTARIPRGHPGTGHRAVRAG